MSEQQQGSKSNFYRHQIAPQNAPSFTIPPRFLVVIEHPFIIEDVDKAIESLGGTSTVHALAQERKHGPPAKLSLHPQDPMCKPIVSNNVATKNIVLKITVPRRTGLKRRRGAFGPYFEGIDDARWIRMEEPSKKIRASSRDTRYLLRSLRDNLENYQMRPIGFIHNTHRFRSMPDFVYSTANSPFMKKMAEHILPFEYEKLKSFKFDMSKGPKPNIDLIPPPRWSHVTIPFNYSYLQNPALRQIVDESGCVRTTYNQNPLPVQNQPVAYDQAIIPTKPADNLPAIDSLEPAMQRLIVSARLLFEKRPIWTRRALINSVSSEDYKVIGSNSAKYIYQYVGYVFESGPWRDAVVKFGVDPRKDPSLRFYQTMMFMLDPEYSDHRRRKAKDMEWGRNSTLKSTSKVAHIFDGLTVGLDGKVWQVCDITDPLLESLLSTTNIRDECHIQGDGWFHSGTWAKAKIIMKSKISTILAGEVPDDNDYVRVVTKLPEIIDDHNFNQARFPRKSASAQEVKLAAQIRAAAKKYQWADWKLQRNSQEQQSGRSLSQYGYYLDKTGHNSGTDDVDMDEYERSEDEDEELDDANEESRRYLRPLTDGRVADVMRELQNVRYSDYSDGQDYEDYEGSEDAAQQSTGAAEMSDGISD